MYVFFRIKLEEDSVEHGKLVSAMTKERLKLDEKVTELNKSLTEVRFKNYKDLFHVYLNRCEFLFLMLHINKTNFAFS